MNRFVWEFDEQQSYLQVLPKGGEVSVYVPFAGLRERGQIHQTLSYQEDIWVFFKVTI